LKWENGLKDNSILLSITQATKMSYAQSSNESNESRLFVDGTAFDCNKTRYSAPKANASGGKAVSIFSTEIGSGLKLSTPLMLTWGASDYEGNKQYAMSLQFPSQEYLTADTSAFLQNMKTFEDKIKADALTYSKEWFGKVHKSPDVIDALFTPMLKYSKDKQTREIDLTKSPTLSVKTPQYDGVWKFEVYDEDENKLFPNNESLGINPLDYLQKGTHLACIIQCGGLWFANGKFGITWRLAQAVVQKPKATIGGKCLLKLKTTDKEKLKAQVAPVVEHVDDVALSVVVEDSDNEDEEVPVQEVVALVQAVAPVVEEQVHVPAVALQEPVAEKKVVKKVIKKKE
jgi:hypothetical protein